MSGGFIRRFFIWRAVTRTAPLSRVCLFACCRRDGLLHLRDGEAPFPELLVGELVERVASHLVVPRAYARRRLVHFDVHEGGGHRVTYEDGTQARCQRNHVAKRKKISLCRRIGEAAHLS